MPSEYTEAVAKGEITEVKDFALRCARAFGALSIARGVPLEEPLSVEDLERLEAKNTASLIQVLTQHELDLERLRALSPEEVAQQAEAEYREELARHEEAAEKEAALAARYRGLLAKVREWKAPTAVHEGLAEYMIDQLESAIYHDCDIGRTPPERETPEAWRSRKVAAFEDRVERTKKEIARAENASAGRVAWYKLLVESFQ